MAKKPSQFFAQHYYKSADDIPVTVKVCTMDEAMKEKAIQAAKRMMLTGNDEKTMAGDVKDVMQQQYGGSWHCVIGRVFSSSVTSSTGRYIYVYVGFEAFMIFQTP